LGAHDDEESPLLDDGWVIWIHGLYYEKPPWLMVNLGMVYDFVLLEYSVFDIYILYIYIWRFPFCHGGTPVIIQVVIDDHDLVHPQ
jgi:hypothetical protein